MVRLGRARRGETKRQMARLGRARKGETKRQMARLGRTMRGETKRQMARLGRERKGETKRQMVRLGRARRGETKRQMARLGRARRGETKRQVSEQDRKVGNGRVYPKNTSLTLPAGELEGRLVMKHNAFIYRNSTNLPADFWRYFEVMTSFWLYNAFQPPFPSEQLTDYSSMVGEAKLPETEVVPLPARGQNNSKRPTWSIP
ncbi:hypothetical protein LSAT2_014342 [Lamellibrachia satsuma]|nr:hypothetical protein LSAT2_014342 [Lamellibrachia satsuma]